MKKKIQTKIFYPITKNLKKLFRARRTKEEKKKHFFLFLFGWRFSTLRMGICLLEVLWSWKICFLNFFQEPILSVFCFLFSLSDCNIVKREEKVLNEMWIMFLYRAGFGKIVETHEILILSLFLVCFQLAIWLSEERLMFGQGLRPLGNDFSSFYQIKILLYKMNFLSLEKLLGRFYLH